ncbi:hypothetical protein, partial [Sphingorhabdus sp.]|uniref:hypothetical protein n=1 Tax=Sphingorhabdus sp. TaxID=1902408 RepID=UPI0039838F3C
MEPRDPDLVARFADHKSRRINLEKQISELEKLTDKKIGAITDEQIERFASAIRAKLRDPSDPQLRKRYVSAFVSNVSMSRQKIVIHGPKAALPNALLSDNANPPAVRTSVSKWCT